MYPTFIRLPANTVRAVFDRYLVVIRRLLDAQLSKLGQIRLPDVKQVSIVLVGGGSLIPYIRQALKDHYTQPGQEVINEEDH